MLEAMNAAQAAERLVVIGCGLRPEDSVLRLAITQFFKDQSWPSKRLIIVDPSASTICSRISEYWGGLVGDQLSTIESRLEGAVDHLAKRVGRQDV